MQERDHESARESCERDSDPTEASCMDSHEMPLTISRKRQAGPDILGSKLGKITENLFLRHSGSQIGKHIRDSDPHPANAGLTTALAWLDRDDLGVIHKKTLAQMQDISKVTIFSNSHLPSPQLDLRR
jgi:hypothetical protein